MKTSLLLRIPVPFCALATAALLAACGGGGGSTPNAVTRPQQAQISGRAVDGPLAGASACYDLNDNGQCDADEPASAPTAADGSFNISVDLALAGRHAVVVDVPASAIDADTGAAVGSAFTLRAPASGTAGSHAVFVSPLTTLVHAHMALAGVTLDAARAFVQSQAGITLSPLADFTLDSSAAAQQTARMARLVQLTSNEQRARLAGVVGTATNDGSIVAAADVEREILSSLVSGLPLVAGTLSDPGLVVASGNSLQALLTVAARSLALQLDVTAETVRWSAVMQRLAEPPPANPPVATGVLDTLRYDSSEDFYYRMLASSAADSLPDANNYRRYFEWHMTGTPNATTGTSVTRGGFVATGNSNNVFWNGSAWVQRSANDRYLSRDRDAQGRSDYTYGGGLATGITIRRIEDISGQALRDVVSTKIRRFPGRSNGVAYANWGPSNLDLYGTARFPANSHLIYQTDTSTTNATQYNPAESNQVLGYSAAVAAGGDSRSNPTLACASSTQNGITTPVTTLEEMVALFRGAPCLFNPTGTAPNQSLNPDEVWGFSTLSLGDLANTNTVPANNANYYSTNARLRVAFAASGNRVSFYRCYARATNNGVRNCSLLGLGTWAIQTVGDGRVLSFSIAPALAQRLNYARQFVERGGRIYYGSKSAVGAVSTQLRLSLNAANAIFQQLGLPRIKPITQPGTATGARAATLSTLQGAWGDATLTEANVWRFGPDGRFFMASAKPFNSNLREQSGAELGWLDHDPTGGYISTQLEVDSNLSSGTSHPQPQEMFSSVTVTPSAITASNGSVLFNRLETASSATSLVGLWGFGSATDLSVPHLAFFSNGQAMIVTHSADPQCVAANQCPPGVEFSSYAYDANTGTLTLFNKLYDTNGCDGAFETCAGGSNNATHLVNIVIAADGRSAVLTDSQSVQTTIYRIQPQ